MTVKIDRQVISAARNMVTEYGTLLDLVQRELTAETDAEKVDGSDAFTIARKAVVKDARKQAFQDFINRIKNYGNQRLE